MRRDGNPNRREACYVFRRAIDRYSMVAASSGLVGIVDVPGTITAGDEVEVQVFEEPAIRLL